LMEHGKQQQRMQDPSRVRAGSRSGNGVFPLSGAGLASQSGLRASGLPRAQAVASFNKHGHREGLAVDGVAMSLALLPGAAMVAPLSALPSG